MSYYRTRKIGYTRDLRRGRERSESGRASESGNRCTCRGIVNAQLKVIIVCVLSLFEITHTTAEEEVWEGSVL